MEAGGSEKHQRHHGRPHRAWRRWRKWRDSGGPQNTWRKWGTTEGTPEILEEMGHPGEPAGDGTPGEPRGTGGRWGRRGGGRARMGWEWGGGPHGRERCAGGLSPIWASSWGRGCRRKPWLHPRADPAAPWQRRLRGTGGSGGSAAPAAPLRARPGSSRSRGRPGGTRFIWHPMKLWAFSPPGHALTSSGPSAAGRRLSSPPVVAGSCGERRRELPLRAAMGQHRARQLLLVASRGSVVWPPLGARGAQCWELQRMEQAGEDGGVEGPCSVPG